MAAPVRDGVGFMRGWVVIGDGQSAVVIDWLFGLGLFRIQVSASALDSRH